MAAAHRELAIRKSALQAIKGLPGAEEEVAALKARISSLQREITGLKPLATQIKVVQQAVKIRQIRLEKAKAEEQQALEKYNYLRSVTNECLQDFKSCQEEFEELQQQAEMEADTEIRHDGYEVDQTVTFQQAVATTAKQWRLSEQLQAAIQAELSAKDDGAMVDVQIATPPRRAQGGLRSPTVSSQSASLQPSPSDTSSPESPRSAEIRRALRVTTAQPTQEYEQEEEEVEEYGDETLFHEAEGHGLPPGAATPVGSMSPIIPLITDLNPGRATTAFRSSSRHAPYPGAADGK